MQQYSYDEAFQASKDYFKNNELSAKVFLDKYALKDNDGNILEATPDAMHDRLALEFARIDRDKYGLDGQERFNIYRNALSNFARIVPQGSPMAAIGNTFQRMSASNCVVVDSPKDSMSGIIETGAELAQLYKRRCGVGVDISTLRPEGASVNNAARTTSGAWSFADFFSYITRLVGQNSRRGALMITMSVHHPDVLKFINMKRDLTKVTGANISVRLSNEFLQAVVNDTEYELRWPCEGNPKIVTKILAKQVWDEIINSATAMAEPGLIMWDNMINNLPAHCYPEFKTISTNPCSEIALSKYDACRLISINLTGYVRNAFEDSSFFDFDAFQADIRTAMQMADNLVDLELELIDRIKEVSDTLPFFEALKNISNHELKKIVEKTPELNSFIDDLIEFKDNPDKNTEKALWDKLWMSGYKGRRTGLGTHGLADTLAQLKLKYDEQESCAMVDKIYRTLRDTAYDASIELAKIRGSFPVYDFDKEQSCEFIQRLPPELLAKMKQYGRRNISLLTQAPTGSVSLLSKVGSFDRFNVSSGVEPVFRNSYVRRKKINPGDKNAKIDFKDIVGDSWQEFTVHHSNVDNFIEKMGTEKLPEYFVTSDQIDSFQRVVIQAVEQKYIDHSISSTINLPKGTQPGVVGNLYLSSWKAGLKGVTVYVDGSRDGVLITSKNTKTDTDGRPFKITPVMAPKRPKELPCDIHHVTVRGTKWTALVGLLFGEPYELFMGKSEDLIIANKHKAGKIIKVNGGRYNLYLDDESKPLIENIVQTLDDNEIAWATRMISTSLRHGIRVEYLVEQLSKEGSVVDVNNVLARTLKKYIKEGSRKKDQCPQCGGDDLIYEEKCKRCINVECGWSGCS